MDLGENYKTWILLKLSNMDFANIFKSNMDLAKITKHGFRQKIQHLDLAKIITDIFKPNMDLANIPEHGFCNL